jgi:Phospholipase_D-nuclease N-terminal
MITGVIGLLLIALIGGLGVAACVFWIWMLIHAITNKGLDSVEKLIWVIVILCLHFVGGLIYFFIGRPKAAGAFS